MQIIKIKGKFDGAILFFDTDFSPIISNKKETNFEI